MDKFVEKFNIFDLFTMLIPGIVISTLFGISLSFKYYDTWSEWGNEKYVVFFILSYLFGVIFQELGTILDKFCLCNILYGGNPKEIFLLDDKYKKIFSDILSYNDALKIKNYIIKSFDIKTESTNYEKSDRKQKRTLKKRRKIFSIKLKHKKLDKKTENDKIINSYIFAYCLNISEMNNLTGKSDKMFVISEMSRSLFWGCVCTIILNLYMVLSYSLYLEFYLVETLTLIFISYIFLQRKKRYEKFRIHILLRALIIYLNQNNKL